MLSTRTTGLGLQETLYSMQLSRAPADTVDSHRVPAGCVRTHDNQDPGPIRCPTWSRVPGIIRSLQPCMLSVCTQVATLFRDKTGLPDHNPKGLSHSRHSRALPTCCQAVMQGTEEDRKVLLHTLVYLLTRPLLCNLVLEQDPQSTQPS